MNRQLISQRTFGVDGRKSKESFLKVSASGILKFMLPLVPISFFPPALCLIKVSAYANPTTKASRLKLCFFLASFHSFAFGSGEEQKEERGTGNFLTIRRKEECVAQ